MQKQYWKDHGTSMRGMMTLHGVDPKHYLDYVHDIDYSPVPHAPDLEASLAKLPGRKIVFTAGDDPDNRTAGDDTGTDGMPIVSGRLRVRVRQLLLGAPARHRGGPRHRLRCRRHGEYAKRDDRTLPLV